VYSMREPPLHRNVQRFRGGLVLKAHRLRASLNSRLESNKEEKKVCTSVAWTKRGASPLRVSGFISQKVFINRFAKVDSRTNPSTYSLYQ